MAIPLHRITPLKKDWINVFGPLTEIHHTRSSGQDECAEKLCGDPRASAYISIALWGARADLY